jgi:hypothetical protein
MTSKTTRARHAIGEPGIRGEPALVKDPDQAFGFHRVKCEAALEYVNLRRVILHRNRRLFWPVGVTLQIIWRKTLRDIWRTLRVWTNWRGSRKMPESSPLIGSACFNLIWRMTAP